jgi:hypothetical protein
MNMSAATGHCYTLADTMPIRFSPSNMSMNTGYTEKCPFRSFAWSVRLDSQRALTEQTSQHRKLN